MSPDEALRMTRSAVMKNGQPVAIRRYTGTGAHAVSCRHRHDGLRQELRQQGIDRLDRAGWIRAPSHWWMI